ncbi:MAG: DUF3667 domain-containing protein [Ignavibacteriales bacterium]|nr:DUF3667 domain-containing protein [Ignavibacteriales bacterium]
MHRTFSKRKYSVCANCSTRIETSYTYCPHCGQANHDLNVPLRHFLEETLEGIFHFDTKSVRTVQTLAFKPGFVTSEFIKGKRARYVAPVRLYIFISFLFFLLLSLLSGKHESVSPADSPSTHIGITFYNINSQELRGLQYAQLDSLIQSRGIALSVLNRYIVRQMARIGTEGQEGFNHFLVKGISYMMFALMPLFAFFIFLLNRKKAQYYIGTLVFSIHYHSFLFLLLIVSLVVNRIVGTSLTLVAPIIICPIYLYLALKHMYDGSRMEMIGQTLLIGILQLISMALLFLVTIFISLLIF